MVDQHTTFFSTLEFAKIWCRVFGKKYYEPVGISVVGSGPDRTMHVIKSNLAFRTCGISAGLTDYCLSPGWTGSLEPSTVSHIIRQIKRVNTRFISWGVRFDHEPLAAALTNLGLKYRRDRVLILKLNLKEGHCFRRCKSPLGSEFRNPRGKRLHVRSTRNIEDIAKYHRLYSHRKFNFPLRLLQELTQLPHIVRLYVVELNTTIVGGALFAKDGNSIYCLHDALDRRFTDLNPSLALIEAGVCWGVETEAKFLNLGKIVGNEGLAQLRSLEGAEFRNNWIFEWHQPCWKAASKLKAGVQRRLHLDQSQKRARVPDGLGWAQRARLGELRAVLCASNESETRNLLAHGASLMAAKIALGNRLKRGINKPLLLDFGCGTGRMIRFFGAQECNVVGIDVTREMLEAAYEFGIPEGSSLAQFDGLTIPLKDSSVDIVWVSGVLKYTLFPPGTGCLHGIDLEPPSTKKFEPTYYKIAREMHRVLKSGGLVVNHEMSVPDAPSTFTIGFEQAGFETGCARVLRREAGLPETFFERGNPVRLSRRTNVLFGKACARLRYILTKPIAGVYQDYLFIWRKLE